MFTLLGISPSPGRIFAPDEQLQSARVVILSHKLFREAEPIPHVFQPVAQLNPRDNPATPDLVIRTVAGPQDLAATIRDVLRSRNRTAIISTISKKDRQLDEQLSPRRFQTWLLSLFSLLALSLASVGLYGVMHYSVAQRTRELGIRIALGAEPRNTWSMILREGLKMMIPGLIAGLLAAYWLTALLSGLLFGVKATDPLTYLTVASVLPGVAMAAISISARRAATVDPLQALRQE